MDVPKVTVWAYGTTQWELRGDLPAYTDLDCQPRFNDAGQFSLTVPLDAKSAAVQEGRLLLFEWRDGQVMTGLIGQIDDFDDPSPQMEVQGLDALAYLGAALAWRDPAQTLPNQPASTVHTSGTAGLVLMNLIAANMVTRRGNPLVVRTQNIGSTIHLRPDFDDLLALTVKKATRGGIGVRVRLDLTSGSRADLVAEPYLPTDRSVRVLFARDLGTMASYRRSRVAPTATRADVKMQVGFRGVQTPEAITAETLWQLRHEVFADAGNAFDNSDADEVGSQALDGNSGGVSLLVTASETPGLKAFRDYAPGDKASARLPDGATITDVITSIHVVVDSDGPKVEPTFGDPDAALPAIKQAKLIRTIRRDVADLKTKG